MLSVLPLPVICLLLLLLLRILSITGNCLQYFYKQPAFYWWQWINQKVSLSPKNTGQTGGDGMRNCWKNLFTTYKSRVLCCMVHQSPVKILINNPGNSFSFLFYVAPNSNNLLWSLFLSLSTKKQQPHDPRGGKWAHMELLLLIWYWEAPRRVFVCWLDP